MSTPAIGDVVIYTNTQAERDAWGESETEWPAIVVISHGDADATIHVLGGSVGSPGHSLVKRCNEDNVSTYDAGTWRPKT
jgi:hypothetical protein